MAYKDAYLTNDQHLIFDTGSERIDLTQRVKSGGFSMNLGSDAIEFEPLTRQAVCRIAGPADVSLGLSGMYYGDEIAKIRAVRSAKTTFAMGRQYDGNPRNATASCVWFMGGYVKTEGFPIDGGDQLLSVASVELLQQEPMFYGENWVRRATHTGSYSTGTYLELAQTYDLDFGTLGADLVFAYDLRGFEQVTGQDIGMRLRVDNEEAGADRVFLYKQLLDPDSAERPKCGFIHFGENEADAKGGNGAYARGTRWPNSGTWRVGVEVNWAVANSIDIGFGYGHRIVT